MSRIFAATVLICLPLAVRAGDRDTALAVLDQAVGAHGGEANLVKVQTAVRSSRGLSATFGKEVPFTEELILQLPDRFRLTVELGGAQKGRILQVVNRDKGWQSTGGAVSAMPAERIEELREEAYLLWLATLAPLRKEADFELAPLAESKINDRAAAGIRVKSKGHEDVRLYFDKETHLLVKLARRGKEAGQPFEQEFLYGEPKEFDGVRLPTRITEMRDGKRYALWTDVSWKFLRSPDESTFSKP
jgi:hypothetical protein